MGDIIQTLNDIDNLSIARSIECDCGDLAVNININKSDLTIISQNIRSIHCNFDDLIANMSCFNFETDVIILTECRLDPNKPIPTLTNYHSYVTTRQLNQNDGVVAYIKDTLKASVTELSLSHATCLQINILNNIILGIYRSPSNTNAEPFINSLAHHLDNLNSEKRNVVVAGDININLKPKHTEQTYELNNRTSYLNMLSGHGILSGHTLSTRESSCLDHFMLKINRKRHTAFIAILRTTITDHRTTFLSLSKIKHFQPSPKHITKIDFESALQYLKNKNLSTLLFCENPNDVTERLIQYLVESLKLNTTSHTIPKSKRIIKPWITEGILRCIRNRNKLQKQSRDDPHNIINKITYARYRNHCNNLIKKLKRKYERNLLSKSLNNNKLLWKNLKNITYTNKSTKTNSALTNLKTSPIESANYINQYFANIGNQLAKDIQQTVTQNELNLYLRSLPSFSKSFVLLDTDIDEVNCVLNSLKPDSAPGWDNISTRYLKHVKYEIIPIITHIVNLCFKQGTFPNLLKKSIITPIYKGGQEDDVNNYRPISVIPVIAKILEKILNSRLINYLQTNNILSPSQFGFRRGVSTEDAVTSLTTLLVKELDKGTRCLTVFIDLKKAFDTVSIPILVQKLEKIGIRDTQLSIFSDYLTNRKQQVKLDNFVSEDVDVTCGVPQGSVLGPTLFLIYLNDLCNMTLNKGKIFSYADDTAIVFTGTTWAETKLNSEKGMIQVASWLKTNLLTLNTNKTNYICFSIYKNVQPELDFNIKIHECGSAIDHHCNCPKINKVNQVKYLGITLDQSLSWYPQIEKLSARIRKFVWIFKTLRHIVPRSGISRNLLNDVYISLVQSVIIYCIPIWGGARKTRFLELERAQRTLIKVMYFKKRTFPTYELYQICNLLSVRKLYIIHLVLKKHKTIPLSSDISARRRKKNNVACMPFVKTEFAKIQYDKRSSYLYNKINKQIDIHTKPFKECKSLLIKWINKLSYDEVENLLLNVM